ncbi:hypothetical protein, partial [Streptomyces sp. NPDC058418]
MPSDRPAATAPLIDPRTGRVRGSSAVAREREVGAVVGASR